MTIKHSAAIAAAAILVSGAAARAQHGGDIFLSVEGGRISTGLIDAEGNVQPGVRVFGAELGEIVPNLTDEPGFDCGTGTFGVPGSIGFRVHGPLLKWQGSGGGSLEQPATAERMEITFASLGPVVTPTGEAVVSGFTLPVGSNGTWHRHLEYTLTGLASQGVYVLEMTLFAGAGSTSPAQESAPFWLVFNQGAVEVEHDAAIDWVTENLAAGACAADFNRSGGATVQDIYDFLEAWLTRAGPADFNGTGDVTVQDIYDFLEAWLIGCA